MKKRSLIGMREVTSFGARWHGNEVWVWSDVVWMKNEKLHDSDCRETHNKSMTVYAITQRVEK